MLRLKADLQQIVISAEYAKQKFKAKEGEEGDGARTVLGANDPVKSIVLDEAGFWTPLVDALKIMTPVVLLLRLMDGDAPAMGKIYPRVTKIRKAIEASSITWKAQALAIHDSRWNYLKSEMHLAGYALDPEFLEDDMTAEVQDALIAVTERNVLRLKVAELLKAGESAQAKDLTTDSDSVQEGVSVAMTELASYQTKEGIFGKAFVKANAKTMAPSKWWEQYGKGTPNLAAVACSVLAQPVCASAGSIGLHTGTPILMTQLPWLTPPSPSTVPPPPPPQPSETGQSTAPSRPTSGATSSTRQPTSSSTAMRRSLCAPRWRRWATRRPLWHGIRTRTQIRTNLTTMTSLL